MPWKKSQTPNPTDLRQRAEERLEERQNEKAVPRDEADARRLVHELEVHQVELEMQNEELQQARAALEAGLASYTDLYDLAPVGYVTLDREGTILRANLTATRLLGRERSWLTGSRLGFFVSTEHLTTFNAFLKRVFESQAKEACEVVLTAQKSTSFWVHIEATASDEGRQQCRAVLADINERRGIEEAREESDKRYREAAEALREADRNRTQFLVMLSHELRNPLAPIKSSLYILDRATAGGDQAKRAQEVIGRQVEQLSRIIDDLLDTTRISMGKVHLKRELLDLNEVVRETVEDHRSAFEQNGVHLEARLAPGPVVVKADWARIVQVVGNLLTNAAKFTERGGNTRVSVSRDGMGGVQVHVADTGTGMSPETLGNLFEPFTQADRTLDRSRGGIGLGLALVKGFVELHSGEVSARSAGPGQGSEFIVRLPLDDVQDVAKTKPLAAERRPRRILIIEDNVDAADSLREALELNDHVVEAASTGREGLEKAHRFKPDVVLCDIGLSGMDGYEVARAFRSDQALKGTFLVALTGYSLPEDLERAANAGFHLHVAKPLSIENLEELLAKAPQRPPDKLAVSGKPLLELMR
jgi:two-component system CheB/CheR fusion protein